MTASALLKLARSARRGVRLEALDLRAAAWRGVCRTEDLDIPARDGPLRARLYRPGGAPVARTVLLYFHGGGFVVGGLDTHHDIAAFLSTRTGLPTLSVEYRLAPEHRHPTQLHDALDAVAHVLDGGLPDTLADAVALSGDSAGGYLAALASLELTRTRPGRVAAQLLLYPLLHLDAPTWPTGAPPLSRAIGRTAVRLIDRWNAPPDGMPNLLSLDLAGSPATVIVTGRSDPMRVDCDALAARLQTADVPVTLSTEPIGLHAGYTLLAVSPRHRASLAAAADRLATFAVAPAATASRSAG